MKLFIIICKGFICEMIPLIGVFEYRIFEKGPET